MSFVIFRIRIGNVGVLSMFIGIVCKRLMLKFLSKWRKLGKGG